MYCASGEIPGQSCQATGMVIITMTHHNNVRSLQVLMLEKRLNNSTACVKAWVICRASVVHKLMCLRGDHDSQALPYIKNIEEEFIFKRSPWGIGEAKE